MKFKLDENLGSRTAGLIAASGHDVETVAQEKLSGATDAHLFAKCAARATAASLSLLIGLVRSLLTALETASIARRALGRRSGPHSRA